MLLGQQNRFVHDSIISNLTVLTENGNKRGLRDLGTFLNHPKLKDKVQKILERLTFFNDQQIYNSKEKFLNYYYKNEQNIQFNQLISAFDNKSKKNITIKYQFKNIATRSISEKDISQLNKNNLEQYINEITAAESPFPSQKLIGIYLNSLSIVNFPEDLTLKIINKISSHPTISGLNTIINFGQNAKDIGTIPLLIEKLTLHKKKPGQPDMTYMIDVKNMIDTIGKINEVRLQYYISQSKTKPNYYFDNVDYLGHLLLFSNSTNEFDDLVVDLKMTHNNRALVYLASNAYLHMDHPNIYKKIILTIESLTGKRLGLENQKGQLIYNNFDVTAFKNYVQYWSKYVDDYIWDNEINHFIHKDDFTKKVQNYDSYIQMLYSKSDSIAQLAYYNLSQGEPEKIAELIKKIRPKKQLLNHTIPNLKYRYLEQLVKLNRHCKENGLEPNLRFKSKLLLSSLLEDRTLQEQYYIEKQVIEYFSFQEITELEKTAILNANNKKLNLSISRILDAIYSKYWNDVIKETSKLSFYLKKSCIFSKIGVSGTAQNYLNKFSKKQVDNKILNRLFMVTQDEDIKQQISILFEKHKKFVSNDANRTKKILDYINKFAETQIIKDKLTKKQIKFAFFTIDKNQNNNEVIDFLFTKLIVHPAINMVPESFKLTAKRKTTLYVKDKISNLLNRIYDENQSIDFWMQLWEKDQKNYKNWGRNLLLRKIKRIQNSERLKTKSINEIIQSKFYEDADKVICLENIKKIKPKKIKYLKFNKLDAKTDLSYFLPIELPVKDLDNIVSFFETDKRKNQALLITFLIDKTRKSSLSKKAKLINNLFRQPFFIQVLENGVITPDQVIEINSILTENLKTSNYISEYEEELSISNILKLELMNKNIIEQIKASIQLDIPINIKAKLQYEILAQIDLNDVVYMLPYFHLLSISDNFNPKEFLYQDFGIPIFEPYPANQLDKLADLLETGNRFEMYKYFLAINKIDFIEERGNLDFNTIYKQLKFGASTTFCSSSGGVDDYFTYSVIKLLEFHFKTRLGFHEKLNENQIFYTFTALVRAEKWMQYLVDQKLVKEDKSHSFNHLIK